MFSALALICVMTITIPSLRGSGLKAYVYLGTLLLTQSKFLQAAYTYRDAISSVLLPQTTWNRDSRPEREYIVSHEHRFVYCPIPKVACSSLKRVMVEICNSKNSEEILKLPNDLFHTYVYHNLTLASFYKEDEALAFLESTNYFKFTFVRNPWSRLVSAYLNKFVEAPSLKGHIFVPDNAREVIAAAYQGMNLQPDFQKMITFRQFVEYVSKTSNQQLDGHWKPQYLFLGNHKFDFIGHLENLGNDFETLKDKLNLSMSVPWSNKSSTKRSNDDFQRLECLADLYPSEIRTLNSPTRYKQFYTSDLVELVRERYRTDVERFDYNF